MVLCKPIRRNCDWSFLWFWIDMGLKLKTDHLSAGGQLHRDKDNGIVHSPFLMALWFWCCSSKNQMEKISLKILLGMIQIIKLIISYKLTGIWILDVKPFDIKDFPLTRTSFVKQHSLHAHWPISSSTIKYVPTSFVPVYFLVY
jgi:hypothetical protein